MKKFLSLFAVIIALGICTSAQAAPAHGGHHNAMRGYAHHKPIPHMHGVFSYRVMPRHCYYPYNCVQLGYGMYPMPCYPYYYGSGLSVNLRF